MTTDTALTTTHTGALVPTDAGELDQNAAAVYLATLSDGSKRTMRQALDDMADMLSNGQADALTLPWARLRYQHTAALRSRLAEHNAPTTVNKKLCALRGVLKQAWLLKQMDADAYREATAVHSIQSERLPAGRDITPGEVAALVATCPQTPHGVRDAALLGVLAAGLRRAEVAGLDLADYHAGAVRVLGKRRKERSVPLAAGAVDALADWLTLRGSAAGPLFLAFARRAAMTQRRLTPQAIFYIVQERAAAAGIGHISPHDFRRTFVGDLLDAGVDMATAQRLTGHSDINTLARYDRRSEDAKRRAVAMLHFPYRRATLRR